MKYSAVLVFVEQVAMEATYTREEEGCTCITRLLRQLCLSIICYCYYNMSVICYLCVI